MALGELAHSTDRGPASDLPEGAAVTASGRISSAKKQETTTPSGPFKPSALLRIDEALTLASREAGLEFSVYLGELGEDSRAGAEQLFDRIGGDERESVLIAISPGERVLEIVTGETASKRIPERGLKLAVMSMVAAFKEGDLPSGIITGLRMLTDQAGSAPT